MQWMDNISWGLIIIACLTLGLAPYSPPHIVEKIQMLFKGDLKRPIDWFDLFFHGIPWILLILKGIISIKSK
ncbi:MAG: hypothetical protein V3V59_00810 [Thermodesulfovibrionales bacterium]